MLPHHARRCFSSVLAGVALLSVLAGCSTSSTSTTPSPTPTATPSATASAGCADAAALKASLDALTKVNVRQDGVAALKSALDDVKTKLDAASASASGALQPEVEQVRTAFQALQSATTGLTADNLVARAPAIRTALTQVVTATKALAVKLSHSCPAS